MASACRLTRRFKRWQGSKSSSGCVKWILRTSALGKFRLQEHRSDGRLAGKAEPPFPDRFRDRNKIALKLFCWCTPPARLRSTTRRKCKLLAPRTKPGRPGCPRAYFPRHGKSALVGLNFVSRGKTRWIQRNSSPSCNGGMFIRWGSLTAW